MLLEIILAILGLFILLWILLRIVTIFADIPAPAFLGPLLDTDIRRLAQPPDKVIKSSGIAEGMRVLEIGCGSGAYTTFVARAIGKNGMVYALDIQPGMLKQLEGKLAKPENRDINNIKLVLASAEDLPFEDGSLDLVYLITSFQEIPDKKKTLQEIKRVLKPGGLIAISEIFPDPDFPLKSTTIRMVKEGGFSVEAVEGGFWNYTVRALQIV